jgi:hypothetical protein
MTYYRLYQLDAVGAHIESAHEFEADNDAAAMAEAEQWLGLRPMELWRGPYKVQHWDSFTPPQAAS